MTAIGGASFDPETVTLLRAAVTQAYNSLPPERHVPGARIAVARAVVKLAVLGERDPAVLSRCAASAIADVDPAQCYDFEVLLGDETVAAMPSVELPNPQALWPRVAELANKAYKPGCRIRVTDKSGAIVIFIGIATARLCFDLGGFN